MNISDKIQKQVTLHAPISRVWRAITDAQEFGQWFGINVDGDFTEGQTIAGTFTDLDENSLAEYQKSLGLQPSAVKMPAPHSVFCTIERINPETYFSFRWIPYSLDAEADPDNEPTTLVEFQLEEDSDGTKVTITESGFDQVPAHRRERAFLMNDGGWSGQAENLKKHVEN